MLLSHLLLLFLFTSPDVVPAPKDLRFSEVTQNSFRATWMHGAPDVTLYRIGWTKKGENNFQFVSVELLKIGVIERVSATKSTIVTRFRLICLVSCQNVTCTDIFPLFSTNVHRKSTNILPLGQGFVLMSSKTISFHWQRFRRFCFERTALTTAPCRLLFLDNFHLK